MQYEQHGQFVLSNENCVRCAIITVDSAGMSIKCGVNIYRRVNVSTSNPYSQRRLTDDGMTYRPNLLDHYSKCILPPENGQMK